MLYNQYWVNYFERTSQKTFIHTTSRIYIIMQLLFRCKQHSRLCTVTNQRKMMKRAMNSIIFSAWKIMHNFLFFHMVQLWHNVVVWICNILRFHTIHEVMHYYKTAYLLLIWSSNSINHHYSKFHKQIFATLISKHSDNWPTQNFFDASSNMQ